MKKLTLILIVALAGFAAQAEEKPDERVLAGHNDFSKDYLDQVRDERAAEKSRSEEARRDHEKYLRQIDRSR